VVGVVTILALLGLPGIASPETHALNASQAAACPECTTPEGGARLVNLLEKLGDQIGHTADYEGPTSPVNYADDADRIFTKYIGLDASSETISGPGTAASTAEVAGGMAEAGSTTGLLPTISAALGANATFSIPVVAAGAGAFAAGFAIGTAGRYLIGRIFGGSSSANQQYFTSRRFIARTNTFVNGRPMPEPGLQVEVYFTAGYRWMDYDCNLPPPDVGGQMQTIANSVRGVVKYDDAGYPNTPPACNPSSATPSYWYVPDRALLPQALQPSSTVPSGYTNAGQPAMPSRTTLASGLSAALNAQPDTTLAQWFEYQLGGAAASDPTGEGADNPDIEFPGWVEHWTTHGDEFSPAYDDPHEYWRDAADIVERADQSEEGYLKCQRSDGGTIYWDSGRQAVVIVKDGKIVTYFVPTGDPFQYWLNECSS